MKQTKLESLIERSIDISTGFIISIFVYKHIILTSQWLWESPLLVTSLFTVISFARGYVWRRFFNAGLHKAVHATIGKLL